MFSLPWVEATCPKHSQAISCLEKNQGIHGQVSAIHWWIFWVSDMMNHSIHSSQFLIWFALCCRLAFRRNNPWIRDARGYLCESNDNAYDVHGPTATASYLQPLTWQRATAHALTYFYLIHHLLPLEKSLQLIELATSLQEANRRNCSSMVARLRQTVLWGQRLSISNGAGHRNCCLVGHFLFMRVEAFTVEIRMRLCFWVCIPHLIYRHYCNKNAEPISNGFFIMSSTPTSQGCTRLAQSRFGQFVRLKKSAESESLSVQRIRSEPVLWSGDLEVASRSFFSSTYFWFRHPNNWFTRLASRSLVIHCGYTVYCPYGFLRRDLPKVWGGRRGPKTKADGKAKGTHAFTCWPASILRSSFLFCCLRCNLPSFVFCFSWFFCCIQLFRGAWQFWCLFSRGHRKQKTNQSANVLLGFEKQKKKHRNEKET